MVTAELFASVPQSVGNITFTPDNRVIYSHHPFFSPDVRVAELMPTARTSSPFPNADVEYAAARDRPVPRQCARSCAATRTRSYGCWTWGSAHP